MDTTLINTVHSVDDDSPFDIDDRVREQGTSYESRKYFIVL